MLNGGTNPTTSTLPEVEIFSGAEQGRFSLGWAEELAILQKRLKNIVDRAVTSHPSRELTAT